MDNLNTTADAPNGRTEVQPQVKSDVLRGDYVKGNSPQNNNEAPQSPKNNK